MKALKRSRVLEQVVAGQLTNAEAAEVLGLSVRQVKRLRKRYREHGAAGLVHGNQGRASSRRLAETTRATIVALAQTTYADYNDCHLTEKLQAAPHHLHVSRSSVRAVRRAAGLPSPRKRRASRHRQRRERRASAGMLLQADGSRHDWLEGRGPESTLLAYIDDATNEVLGALFREAEDAAGYFLGLQHICQTHGLPLAIYADRHTIFQSPAASTRAEENPTSQLGRLLEELGIELIAAHSPQAKGRIERLWGTLQDRLVKALREAQACTLAEANRVLATYLPEHNARFRVPPRCETVAYVPWPDAFAYERYFCFKYHRRVANDNTISFNGHKLHIPPNAHRANYAHAKVELHQHLDGHLAIVHDGRTLVSFLPADSGPPRVGKFQPLAPLAPADTPVPAPVSEPSAAPARTPHKPAANHPWRHGFRVPTPQPKSEPTQRD
jgi:transposase